MFVVGDARLVEFFQLRAGDAEFVDDDLRGVLQEPVRSSTRKPASGSAGSPGESMFTIVDAGP
jgi:hypothetical protein